eukprot:GHVR01067927.1.p1 GENE.GHVR01067927.1~~GHVR01067927.1.p1  ORF type:complete len:130 (+),score=10.64 GHVR01067927.1:212-601(+)
MNVPVPSLQNDDRVPIKTVTPARVPREQILYGGNSHSRGTYPLPYGWDRDIEMITRSSPGEPDEALYTLVPWDVAFPRGPELCQDRPMYDGEQLPETDGSPGYSEEQCPPNHSLKSWGLGETKRLAGYK